MARYPELAYRDMTLEQRRVHDLIASGPRGSVSGPFVALLRSPDLCDRIQNLGAFIRFERSLPDHLCEFAILVTAQHWKAQYEWHAHAAFARRAGIPDSVIEAVRVGDHTPLDDTALQLIRDFASSLLTTGRVPDPLHEAATELFGERGVIELVATIGYYCMVSLVLNTAEVPAPSGEPPLPESD